MSDRKIFAITNTYAIHYSHDILNSDVFSIIAIEEDEMPPQYFFFSEYLTDLENKNEIWGKGLFLLSLYNGAVNIHLVNHDWDSRVRFTRLQNWVTYENMTPNNTVDILPVNPFPDDIVTDTKKKSELKDSHFITYSAFLSKSEKDVQSLLLLAGNKLNWITLYAIYDTLKFYSADFAALVTKCDYTQNDINAFTGTANNFGLLGINARHGEKGWSQPSNTMSLQDSKKLVLKLAKQYIIDK
ncbi:MAG: hypothetical protein NXH90_04265 [Flavobacteriaceae bacterium]|nr:hypothetical protein [Flavobacteriaceae bacterium]